MHLPPHPLLMPGGSTLEGGLWGGGLDGDGEVVGGGEAMRTHTGELGRWYRNGSRGDDGFGQEDWEVWMAVYATRGNRARWGLGNVSFELARPCNVSSLA